MSEQSSDVNRQLRLARRPTGLVEPEDFERVDEPLPELAEGEALMRTIYLGMDATVRTWLNRGEGYLPAVEVGEVVRGSGIGRVVATRCDAYEIGDVAYGLPGWQDYAIVRDDVFTTKIADVTDLRSMMSVFGATGAAAYFGLLDIGQIAAGETVVVSAAAGATGSIAGQIAKLHGCRVVGHRRQRREVRLGGRRARLRRVHQPSHRGPAPGSWPSCARTGSTCTSTTWAAPSSTPCSVGSTSTAGWCCAAPSPPTTTRVDHPGRRTTST